MEIDGIPLQINWLLTAVIITDYIEGHPEKKTERLPWDYV